ncbi:hypothetical protein BKA93DRAFT_904210 [Sparassis latifolia]
MQKEVINILRTSAPLAGSSASVGASALKDILRQRLVQYYQALDKDIDLSDGPLEDLQLETATEALCVIERLQAILIASNSPEFASIPAKSGSKPSEGTLHEGVAIGTRDLAQIRTLISIIFKWALEPLLGRVIAATPTKPSPKHHGGAQIIDLTDVPADYETLSSAVTRLMHLLLPGGLQGPLAETIISLTLLNRHLTDILTPCIVLGWMPKRQATDSVRPVDDLRPLVIHLLSILPASQTIAALGGILSHPPSALSYVRKSCGFLLSRQLLRPEGVPGLLAVVFGEEDVSGDDAPLEKLEHVGRLLCTVPTGTKPNEYYENVITRLITILSTNPETIPPAHRRAAAFSLSRMLLSGHRPTPGVASGILLTKLHLPFLVPSPRIPVQGEDEAPTATLKQRDLSPSISLSILQTLLTNADPSPTFISSLLTPIIPTLYAILFRLDQTKTSDPATKDSLKSLLMTWGRVVCASEGLQTLWSIINGEGGEWQVDMTGTLTRVEELTRAPSLSLFTPESLRQAEDSGEFSVDSNPLDLRPDPVHFVKFLNSLDRSDISSELFMRMLEAYREVKSEADADPLRTLMYLQLILQMQSQLTADGTSSNILKKPAYILSFIKHALESANKLTISSGKRSKPSSAGLRMEDLRIVEEEDEELEDEDSDDEAQRRSGDQEMLVTAVDLLLSVLEANPDLSARTAPILNDIFSLLEPLSKDSSETLRPLVREARMVMTARLASTSASFPEMKTSATHEDSPQQIYQKALKLLQDPLLPVRAHGLLLLRQLVSTRRTKSGLEEPSIDRALVPAILSIFLQSIQDDDSYMYLNAVQGLAAMVDGFGKEVLKGLVDIYSQGLDGLGGSGMTQQDVDARTRVGEALGQVIRRCGDVLPAYGDLLVPPLFAVMSASHFPTTMRTSALSLLAQCAKTDSLVLLPYSADLSTAMIDLLQLESVRAPPRKDPASPDGGLAEDKETCALGTMDSQPTSTNSKFPPLRRVALHFLLLLVQACTMRLYDSPGTEHVGFPVSLMRRGKSTLGYIAATDEDGVVRVMARETLEGLEQLEGAMVGL